MLLTCPRTRQPVPNRSLMVRQCPKHLRLIILVRQYLVNIRSMQISADERIAAIEHQLDMVAVIDKPLHRRRLWPTAIWVYFLLILVVVLYLLELE
jgi:hypothetical protein